MIAKHSAPFGNPFVSTVSQVPPSVEVLRRSQAFGCQVDARVKNPLVARPSDTAMISEASTCGETLSRISPLP